jgi:NitT/TauT family transport system substrate-binding protein
MKAKNDDVFKDLKDGYKKGIVKDFSQKNIDASSKVFKILLEEGGKTLVGKSISLDQNTFWDFEPDIKW